MTRVTVCITTSSSSSSSSSYLPPKLHTSTSASQPPSPSSKLVFSRRNTALSLSIATLFPFISPPAFAFDFDFRISGPKDWLKEQKKKSIKYVLAPIIASRDILTYAQQLLLSKDSRLEEKEMEEIRGMLNTASRDCVAVDRSSLVALQARTGVEVCTFTLVVSNASSLLSDNDPTKLEAEVRLNDLIRSFAFLNGLAKEADVQVDSSRQKVADALTDTLLTLDKFEEGVKGCIEA